MSGLMGRAVVMGGAVVTGGAVFMGGTVVTGSMTVWMADVESAVVRVVMGMCSLMVIMV